MTSKRKQSPPEMDEDFDWLTVQEACEVLKCSKRKIDELRRDGRLEIVRFDRAVRVTKRSLNRLLKDIFTGSTPS